LIIDDEPSILRLVALVLQDLGCEALQAPDAETAEQILGSARPAFIITDVRLPGIDGLELTRRVKSHAELSQTPVLLMSAFGEPPGHCGDAFLAKPFDIDGFTEFVKPYIGDGR
jgi:DNA-binding response OmpR family regulator